MQTHTHTHRYACSVHEHTTLHTHTSHRQLTHYWLLWRQASQSILKTVAEPLLYCVGSHFLVLAFLNHLWQGPCKRVQAPVCSISLLMLLTPCSFSHSPLAHSVTCSYGGNSTFGIIIRTRGIILVPCGTSFFFSDHPTNKAKVVSKEQVSFSFVRGSPTLDYSQLEGCCNSLK